MTTQTTEDPLIATKVTPITLSQLRELLPPFKDVEIEGVGMFRLHRLNPIDVLEFQSKLSDSSDENETVDKEKFLEVSLEFIAKALGGEFDTDEGAKVLKTLPFAVQTQLIHESMEASRANIGKRIQQIEEAKNE